MTRAKLLVTICQIEWSRSQEYPTLVKIYYLEINMKNTSANEVRLHDYLNKKESKKLHIGC